MQRRPGHVGKNSSIACPSSRSSIATRRPRINTRALTVALDSVPGRLGKHCRQLVMGGGVCRLVLRRSHIVPGHECFLVALARMCDSATFQHGATVQDVLYAMYTPAQVRRCLNVPPHVVVCILIANLQRSCPLATANVPATPMPHDAAGRTSPNSSVPHDAAGQADKTPKRSDGDPLELLRRISAFLDDLVVGAGVQHPA